jgi:ribulose 1,5-bisphosphate carboxylase large subunit-like protein
MRELQKLIHQRVEKRMALVMLTVKNKETKKAKRVLLEVNITLKMSLMRRTSHG